MYKILALSFLVATVASCSSSSTEEIIEDILNKDSVTLAKLDQHAVTYEKTSDKATHVDVYCPGDDLRDENGVSTGSWMIVNNNDISLNTGRTYKTTNATLEKDVTYSTENADTFKVTKISETICL